MDAMIGAMILLTMTIFALLFSGNEGKVPERHRPYTEFWPKPGHHKYVIKLDENKAERDEHGNFIYYVKQGLGTKSFKHDSPSYYTEVDEFHLLKMAKSDFENNTIPEDFDLEKEAVKKLKNNLQYTPGLKEVKKCK